MRFDVKGARLRTLMGLGNLAVGVALCGTAGAQDQAGQAKTGADERASKETLPQVMISGKRSLNVDIQRTRDDIQPYVVFDAEQISRSGAQKLEDFLQTYLPMNAQQVTTSQLGPQTSPEGRIDLRGLGASQTLILVDGRRLPNISTGDSFRQPNLNGIPLSQIERIEILPATASGIYGGGATGGVINIILKRDYAGVDVDVGYGNALDGGVMQYNVGVSGGFSLEGGRTHVQFSASHADAGVLQSTRRDFAKRGAELQLRNDPTHPSVLLGGANICATDDGANCSTQPLLLKNGTATTSAFTSVPGNYPGAALDGGAALAARAGQLQLKSASVPIWSAPETTSFSFNPRREFTKDIDAYLDFAYDRSKTSLTTPTQLLQYVPASATVNPFQQDVLSYLTVPNGMAQEQVVRNTRLYVGTIVRLPQHWNAVLEAGQLRNSTSSTNGMALSAASPAADETLQGAVFRDIVASPLADANSLFSFFKQKGEIESTLKTASLRLSGPLAKLPGGDLTATALLEGRHEISGSSVNTSEIGGTSLFSWTPEARRKVESQYLELRAPVIAGRGEAASSSMLELMASVRHDAYRTEYSGSSIDIDSASGPFPAQEASVNRFGSANYTVGLRFAPTTDVAVRTSLGTGFLPPDLAKIRSEAPAVFSPFLISLLDLRDPAQGNTLIPGPLTVLSGGSPSLQPEESRSASLGLVLTPRRLPGLRVSVDYTDIRKSNEVSTMPLQYFIDNEAAFPGRVVRGPGSGGQPGAITQVDGTSLNLARTRLKAFDLQADYVTTNETWGRLRFYAVATYTKALSRGVQASGPAVNRSGFSDGPLKWRGNFGIDWSGTDTWSAGWNAQYYDSYRVCQSTLSEFSCNQWETWQGASKVPSQIYHDAYVRYSFNATSGLLADTDLSFGLQNVFNNQGATIASALAYTVGATSNLDPRGRRFTVMLRKHL